MDLAIDAALLKRLRGVLFNHGVRGPDLEDYAQDAILALLKAGSTVRKPWNYLVETAKHLAVRHAYNRARERHCLDVTAIEQIVTSQEPDPETQLIQKEMQALATSVIHCLPGREAEVLEQVIQGKTQSEICEDMKIEQRTFWLTKSQGKRRLQQRMDRITSWRKAA